MGNSLLDLVPPVHRLPNPGPDSRDLTRRVHPYGQGYIPIPTHRPREQDRYIQGCH